MTTRNEDIVGLLPTAEEMRELARESRNATTALRGVIPTVLAGGAAFGFLGGVLGGTTAAALTMSSATFGLQTEMFELSQGVLKELVPLLADITPILSGAVGVMNDASDATGGLSTKLLAAAGVLYLLRHRLINTTKALVNYLAKRGGLSGIASRASSTAVGRAGSRIAGRASRFGGVAIGGAIGGYGIYQGIQSALDQDIGGAFGNTFRAAGNVANIATPQQLPFDFASIGDKLENLINVLQANQGQGPAHAARAVIINAIDRNQMLSYLREMLDDDTLVTVNP